MHLTGKVAGCVARLEPIRTEYLEQATAVALLALLALEVRLLLRDQHRPRGLPSGGTPAGPGPPGPRRPPRPRSSSEQRLDERVGQPTRPDRL